GFVSSRSAVFPIAFVLVALATVVPLRDRVQRAVDRLFYRGRVDYKDTVARASERMTTLLDRDAIVQHLLTALREVLFIEGATLWELEDDALVRRGGSAGVRRIPAGEPGLAVFEARGGVLSRDEAEESARLWRQRDALRALFDALGATLLVPLLRQGRPAGLLAVGGKASGRPFSADDMDVLGTLANQTAIALANAAALEELREAQESLARAERLAAVGELSAAVAHGRADSSPLGQALRELGVNAIEATGGGGRITISAAASGNGLGRVRLGVTDTGPGVAPEMRQRIFQLFMTTKSTGTGVGLAVVRKIIERHGGTITVEAAERRGARFVVALPAA